MKYLWVVAGVVFFLTFSSTLIQSPAQAAVEPEDTRLTNTLVSVNGEALAFEPKVSEVIPKKAVGDWQDFISRYPGSWKSLWNVDTKIPLRIYGSGIPVFSEPATQAVSSDKARAFFKRNIGLLAPGSTIFDFSLVSNHLDTFSGVRTIGFVQHKDGRVVEGGQVSFRFKHGRLIVMAADSFPDVASATGPLFSPGSAVEVITEWMESDFGTADYLGVDSPVYLPLVTATGMTYPLVYPIHFSIPSPTAQFVAYVDAQTGQVIGRKQTLLFAAADLTYRLSDRYPGSDVSSYAASNVQVGVNGTNQFSTDTGFISWSDDTANVETRPRGQFVTVQDVSGMATMQSFSAIDGDSLVWEPGQDEFTDAVAMPLIYLGLAKAYARTLVSLDWLDQSIPSVVNINDECNAYSNGNTVGFFRSSSRCNNTARISDIIYHEFSHSLHAHAIIPGAGDFDSALSEGVSDYYSATLTNDSGMGRGFRYGSGPLREINPASREVSWPNDISSDPHETGRIVAGALWDLRTSLREKHGDQVGTQLADKAYMAILRGASNIPTSYSEVLAADDDDGNLSNGTPNSCEIDIAFAKHGLADQSALGAPLQPYTSTGSTVRVRPQPITSSLCQTPTIEAIRIVWRTPGATSSQTQDLSKMGEDYSITLPGISAGSVVRFQLVAEYSSGLQISYPKNPAAPWYDLFVGESTPLYCTDFETDPRTQGWVTGTRNSGRDDWDWGRIYNTTTSGDPIDPYSGSFVFGTDLGKLGADGNYSADNITFAKSPNIVVSGYESIHLQYRRWLNVEDGTFDFANLYGNDQLIWRNQIGSDDFHHRDQEWRFHDVNMTSLVKEGRLQVTFDIHSDNGVQFGGWTIDDFCIVGVGPTVCGNGIVEGSEQCDAGADNTAGLTDGCRDNCLIAYCGDGVIDSAEQCDDGNSNDEDNCSNSCVGTPEKKVETTSSGCQGSGPSSAFPTLLLLFGFWRCQSRRQNRSNPPPLLVTPRRS